jgi:hypothetical protein
VNIAKNGCAALRNLANNADNNTKLGQKGACEVVLQALDYHILNANFAEEGLGCIRNMAANNA